jgi:hypothetical protein
MPSHRDDQGWWRPRKTLVGSNANLQLLRGSLEDETALPLRRGRIRVK